MAPAPVASISVPRSDRTATLVSAAVGVLAALAWLVVLLASSDSAPAATAGVPGAPSGGGGASSVPATHLTPSYLQAHLPKPPGTHVNGLNPDATKPDSAGPDHIYLDFVAPQSIGEVKAFYQRELVPLGLTWNPLDDGSQPGTAFNGSLDSASDVATSYGALALSALGGGQTEIEVFLLRHPG